jgi:carboxypeptidase family protein
MPLGRAKVCSSLGFHARLNNPSKVYEKQPSESSRLSSLPDLQLRKQFRSANLLTSRECTVVLGRYTVTQKAASCNLHFEYRAAFVPGLVLSGLLLVLGFLLNAQAENGINGTVTDSSGGVIAGAHVTVTNTATNVVSSAITSSEGSFIIVGLIPGRYSIAVDSKGFKRTQSDVSLKSPR